MWAIVVDSYPFKLRKEKRRLKEKKTMLFKINNTCSKTSKLFLKYYAINILSSTFYNDDPGKLSVKISCVAPTLPPAPDLSTVEAF